MNSRFVPLANYVQKRLFYGNSKPQHLICFKQWTADMVMEIINSAINLKCYYGDTHGKRLNILKDNKITILQEVNEPTLKLAVSKAATLLGAYDVTIVDHVMWEHDYLGKVFSLMTDAIFVSTQTHMCIQRFSEQATVPVMCMRSRTHASIQAMATIMAVIEEYGTMCNVNVAYVGPSHPVLNSYLLLCPMLGANIKHKCCCQQTPVSPLLMKASEDLVATTRTISQQCTRTLDALRNATVVIAGPTPRTEKIEVFKLVHRDIQSITDLPWIFFHTCPRGKEVGDDLFLSQNSRTFKAFDNFQFIAASLMAKAVKGYRF